jgi:hypothetical protein
MDGGLVIKKIKNTTDFDKFNDELEMCRRRMQEIRELIDNKYRRKLQLIQALREKFDI